MISGVCLGALAVGFGLTAAQPGRWFESAWPTEALPTIAREAQDTATTVYAISRLSDWVYWHEPNIRGRLAHDIRFEVYRRQTVQATADFVSMRGLDWARQADGYRVVVVDEPRSASMTRALVRRGRVVVFSGTDASVLVGAR